MQLSSWYILHEMKSESLHFLDEWMDGWMDGWMLPQIGLHKGLRQAQIWICQPLQPVFEGEMLCLERNNLHRKLEP